MITPEWEDLVLEMIRNNQLDLFTGMPGNIVKYDETTQIATVQPSFKSTYIDPLEVVSLPPISNVPVVFPRIGKKGVCFPVEVGDPVLLIFMQRSLDDWIDEGGEVEIKDTRLHNINDPIALPGLYPISGAMDPAPPKDAACLFGDKILIGNSKASTEPMVLGTVLNTNLEALLDAIKQLTTLLATGAPIANPSNGQSTIVVTPVDAALEQVRTALPNHNSDFIFGEKTP
jgi:hypothetical protein